LRIRGCAEREHGCDGQDGGELHVAKTRARRRG
jgi:hypothetical protein